MSVQCCCCFRGGNSQLGLMFCFRTWRVNTRLRSTRTPVPRSATTVAPCCTASYTRAWNAPVSFTSHPIRAQHRSRSTLIKLQVQRSVHAITKPASPHRRIKRIKKWAQLKRWAVGCSSQGEALGCRVLSFEYYLYGILLCCTSSPLVLQIGTFLYIWVDKKKSCSRPN